MFIINNQFVAPLDHTKYITYSSLLFFCPSFYAFIKKEYLLSIALFAASLASINHWRHPTYSWRRIVDHIVSKVAFMICFVNGFFLYTSLIIPKIIFFTAFLYCYYMSDKYCNCNIHVNNMDPCWWKYHVSFHFFSTCTQMLIIWSI
jgi:hypothetical protein